MTDGVDVSGPHAGARVLTAGAPLAAAKAAVVMVHGRGGSAADILSLADAFAHPDVAYVAPEANGNTWYPNRFIEPTARNEPWLSSALALVTGLVVSLEAQGMERRRIVLLGFSQGACLATEAAARAGVGLGGVVGLSGGLIGAPGETLARGDGAFDRMPVILGCSERDPHIPVERVHETAAYYTGRGAMVTTRIYPGSGHGIYEDEVTLVRQLLGAVAAA